MIRRSRARRSMMGAISHAGPANAIDVFQADEDVARLRAIGWAKNAREMELIDDACRTPVADLESPLKKRRGSLLVLDDNFRRFAEQLVSIGDLRLFIVVLTRVERLALSNRLENIRLVDGSVGNYALRHQYRALCLTTLLVPPHEMLGVFAREKCALNARRLRFPRRDEQHVAVAEEHFGTGAVDDGATVDL